MRIHYGIRLCTGLYDCVISGIDIVRLFGRSEGLDPSSEDIVRILCYERAIDRVSHLYETVLVVVSEYKALLFEFYFFNEN